MSVEVIKYRDFKDKIRLTKMYQNYFIEDLGNNILMFSKKIEINN